MTVRAQVPVLPAPALRGELLPADPGCLQINDAAFHWECGRLWRETVEALGLGYNPVGISNHVAHIALDPWSDASKIPYYGAVPPRPTPALMPRKKEQPK